jgi:hypothetical protein
MVPPNPISQALSGFAANAQGLIPDMIRGFQAPERENQTVRLLMQKGNYDQETATAIARNPEMMKQVLPQLFGSKGVTLGPGQVHFRPGPGGSLVEAARGGDKFINLAEGASLIDPTTRQPVFQSGPKQPELVKDYNFYSEQETKAERQPKSFGDWDLARKSAAAQTVNINPNAELEFKKKASGVQAERFGDIVKKGETAREMIGDLSSLADLAKQFETGVPAQLTQMLGPYAEALGIKIDNLGPIQAYQSIVDRLAPRMRVPGSGATSDFDARQFLRSMPQLGNMPEGNQVIRDTLQAIQESHIAASEIASRALAEEITPQQAEKELRALPDPFSKWKASRGTAPTGGGRVRAWTPGSGLSP